MTEEASKPMDPSVLLLQMLAPATGQLSSFLSPSAVRRILEAILEEVDLAFVPHAKREARAQRVEANLRWLGLTPKRFVPARFVERYVHRQIRRQAGELVCIFANVDGLLRWAHETASIRGISHARHVAAAGSGAVVTSAHLGPLVFYGAVLGFFLGKKKGPVPVMTMVANPPSNPRVEEQLRDFNAGTRATLHYIVKEPGQEETIRAELDERLRRGEWVLIQVDVETGGRSRRPLAFCGRQITFPGVWGAVRLAARHHVPLLPVRAFQNKLEGLGLLVERPTHVEGGEDSPHVAPAAQALATVLEGWVKSDPAEWGILARVHKMSAEPG